MKEERFTEFLLIYSSKEEEEASGVCVKTKEKRRMMKKLFVAAAVFILLFPLVSPLGDEGDPRSLCSAQPRIFWFLFYPLDFIFSPPLEINISF